MIEDKMVNLMTYLHVFSQATSIIKDMMEAEGVKSLKRAPCNTCLPSRASVKPLKRQQKKSTSNV